MCVLIRTAVLGAPVGQGPPCHNHGQQDPKNPDPPFLASLVESNEIPLAMTLKTLSALIEEMDAFLLN